MDVTDRVCNLECVKAGKTHEFVGPVKIILVDPSASEYKKKTLCAGLITLAYIVMGATMMTVLFFSLNFKLTFFNNLHVFLCTVGFQLCIPCGILLFANLNGASAPMRASDKKFQHFFLQSFGLGCAAAGSALVFFLGSTSEPKLSIHFFLGVVACGLGTLGSLGGPVAYFSNPQGTFSSKIRKNHALFGALAFAVSSGCFVLGILKKPFTDWLPLNDISSILIAFCVFYTFVVIYFPLSKLYSKNEEEVN